MFSTLISILSIQIHLGMTSNWWMLSFLWFSKFVLMKKIILNHFFKTLDTRHSRIFIEELAFTIAAWLVGMATKKMALPSTQHKVSFNFPYWTTCKILIFDIIFVEILRNISLTFAPVVYGASVLTTNETKMKRFDLTWDLVPSFPICKNLDLHDYFDLTSNTPLEITIYAKQTPGVALTVLFEERERKLKRALKSLRKNYLGPVLKIDDLNRSRTVKAFITLSQTINTERDTSKPCRHYPYKHYKTYSDCDQEFINKRILETYGVIPFWTAKSLDDVTKLRLHSA